MAKKCAYCDATGSLTGDHVWPSCFLDRVGRSAAHFSVKAQRVHGADYVVKDVCANCNANRLSELDAYFCSLYDEYLSEARDFSSTVVFRYEFNILARALLKIAYNTARSARSIVPPLANVRSYILGLSEAPSRLALFLEIVSPSMVPDPKEPSGLRKVMPENLYRSALAKFVKPGGERVLARVVAVNSFYFHLMLPRDDISKADFEGIARDFEQSLEGAVRLWPNQSEAMVASSPQHALRSLAPHLKANAGQYGEFFAGRRKTKP